MRVMRTTMMTTVRSTRDKDQTTTMTMTTTMTDHHHHHYHSSTPIHHHKQLPMGWKWGAMVTGMMRNARGGKAQEMLSMSLGL
jgi:hypothetical protein